jgi:competence protein ComFC
MSIRMVLKKLADMVFPYIPGCVVCGVEKGVDAYLCPDCKKEMDMRRAGTSNAGVFAACSMYEYDGPVARLVRRYKYNDDKWLSAFLAEAIVSTCDIENVDVICHVPLHEKRRKSRGFDQAEELAKRVAEKTGKPYICALKRIRNTRTQTKLNAAERQENMRGAFESMCPVSGHVALVDDVLTTGATAAECAQVLMAAGAQSVTVVTFARAIKA